MVNGKAVSLKGRTKPFSDTRETVFDVNVTDLDIPHYLEYVPIRREYAVPTASLDVKGAISLSQALEGQSNQDTARRRTALQ